MRMLHLGLRVSDLEQSLAFYGALGYAELGSVPQTEFGSLTMLQLPDDPFVSLELVHDPERPVEDVGATWLSRWTIWMPRSQTSRQRALRLRRRLSRGRDSGPHG
jgi:catechol 2,3-dioxygenase-like lactoylglutathione lyase family enzyme